MNNELDLRRVHQTHEPDPTFEAALEQHLEAILAGAAHFDHSSGGGDMTIDLTAERLALLERHRRTWVVIAATLVGAAAAIAAIVVVTARHDTLAPTDSVPATASSMDDSVPETAPPTTLPFTPELFAAIAPGSTIRLPDPPLSGRVDTSAVWTGSEMVVWGGLLADGQRGNDGAAFNLANGTWRAIASAPLSPRQAAAAVWTGSEVLVWGGIIADDVRLYDGAAYNPTTDTWRLLPEVPVSMGAGSHILSMVWTGSEAIVVGGATAAAYDPFTNSWRQLADPPSLGYPAMLAGDSIVLLDGNRMMRYDLAADSWTTEGLGEYAELVYVPVPDGFTGSFIALPTEMGAPTQLLDMTGNPIAELPSFPGNPSLFGDQVGATGRRVGDEVVFWIWTGAFPYEPEQVWALNPTTQTWRHLDNRLVNNEATVVAGDVMLTWGVVGNEIDSTAGAIYRAGVTTPN